MRPLLCAHTAWVEGTLTHSLTHSLIHSLTSHFHAQSGAHIRSLTHPDSLISKSHRVECKRTHSVASHSHKQIRGHTHEPPILTNRGMEGTLTHSLTDLPLEGVGGQIGDHTHSNSLSHTDSRARALSHSLTYSLSLSHKLSPSLTLSHTPTLTLLLSLSLSLTNA